MAAVCVEADAASRSIHQAAPSNGSGAADLMYTTFAGTYDSPTVIGKKPMRRIFAMMAAVLAFALAHTGAAQAQPDIRYLTFDVDIALRQDGSFFVQMVQRLEFDGEYSSAFFEIPLDYTTTIENVELFTLPEDGNVAEAEPLDAAVDYGSGSIFVEWAYPTTQPGDVRSFMLTYDVIGGLWTYPQQDFLMWDAVNADRSGLPVDSSRVTVTLPPSVDPDAVEFNADGPPVDASVEGNRVVFEATAPLPDGEAFNVVVRFPHGLLDASVSGWQKEEDRETLELTIDRIDTSLAVQPDGAVQVHERMEVSVERSYLYEASRFLALTYIDDVQDVAIAKDGEALQRSPGDCEMCFALLEQPRQAGWVRYAGVEEGVLIDEDAGGSLTLDWSFPAVGPGESAVFDLRYTLEGALRAGDEDQLLTWDVLPDYDVPVQAATVTVLLPPGVEDDALTVEGSAAMRGPQPGPDGGLLYSYDGPVQPHARWQVAVTLPAAATTAAPPRWQNEWEQAIVEQQAAAAAAAQRGLALRVGGLAGLVLGVLGLVFSWYRWGRERVRQQLGGYVAEPPSELDPAIVAYLVERKATARGVLAAVFHLAQLGVITIDGDAALTLRRVREDPLRPGERLATPAGDGARVSEHSAYLFNSVIAPVAPVSQPAALAALEPRLEAALPELHAHMAADIRRYFTATPQASWELRRAAPWWLGALIVASIALFTGASAGMGALQCLALPAVLALGVIGAAAGRRGGEAAYSDEGATEAEQWRRFRAYLQDLKKYGDQADAQDILDRYFAYAVALGVENVVLEQAEELGGRRPVWMPMPSDPLGRPWPRQSSRQATGRPVAGRRPAPLPGGASAPRAEGERPTLSGMSHSMGAGLSGASNRMATMLDAASGSAAPRVTISGGGSERTLTWKPGTSAQQVMDDILKQPFRDLRAQEQARQAAKAAQRAAEEAQRAARQKQEGGSSGGSWGGSWGGGQGGSSSSRSSSSGSFGRRSSSHSGGSRSSSSGGSRRSGGGGKSGFR